MEKIKSVLMPGHSKEDEVKHGPGSSGQPSQSQSDIGTQHLRTDSGVEQKDHGVLRQILNPDGAKYDEVKHGTTTQPEPPLSGSTAPGTTASKLKVQEADRPASVMSIKSGVEGPFAGKADEGTPGSVQTSAGGLGGQMLPDRTLPHDGHRGSTDKAIVAPTQTERTFPLSGGTRIAEDPTSRIGSDEATHPGATSGNGLHSDSSAPLIGAGTSGITREPLGQAGSTTGTHSHLGRDAALTGAGVAGAGALAHDHSGSHQAPFSTATPTTSGRSPNTAAAIPGDPFGYHRPDEKPVEGYVHHTKGPHATDMANWLDPHVPGEFPGATGEDVHGSQREVPLGVTGTAGTSAIGSQAQPGAHDHHLGRDAALAGVAGTVGLGAYEAGKGREGNQEHPIATTTNTVPHQTGASDVRGETEPSHHYGRDAALVGGAGAAGVGGYEASKDRLGGDQRPMDTATDSDAGAAGADPYAQSRGSTAIGNSPFPGPSSAPRGSTQQDVRNDPQPYHHHGRDAAMTGGAAAAGVAGYEALQDRHQPAAPLDPQSAGRRHSPIHDMPTMTTREPIDVSGNPLRTADQPVGPTYALPMEAATSEARRRSEAHPTTGATSVQPAPEAFNTTSANRPHGTRDFGRDPAAIAAAEAGRRHAAPDDGKHHNKLEKNPRQIEKHERDLEKAREKETAVGGDRGHKDGLLSKIIHPHRRSGENPRANEPSRVSGEYRRSGELGRRSGEVNEPHTGLPMDLSKGDGRGGTDGTPTIAGAGREPLGAATAADRGDSAVKEPHTGLPMNVGRYGDGHGGTDGAPMIDGAERQPLDPNAGADWDKLKKGNTIY